MKNVVRERANTERKRERERGRWEGERGAKQTFQSPPEPASQRHCQGIKWEMLQSKHAAGACYTWLPRSALRGEVGAHLAPSAGNGSQSASSQRKAKRKINKMLQRLKTDEACSSSWRRSSSSWWSRRCRNCSWICCRHVGNTCHSLGHDEQQRRDATAVENCVTNTNHFRFIWWNCLMM